LIEKPAEFERTGFDWHNRSARHKTQDACMEPRANHDIELRQQPRIVVKAQELALAGNPISR
jgi:hypothetical protein